MPAVRKGLQALPFESVFWTNFSTGKVGLIFTSGIYFDMCESSGQMMTKKIILLK
jgi:hypothetical protein